MQAQPAMAVAQPMGGQPGYGQMAQPGYGQMAQPGYGMAVAQPMGGQPGYGHPVAQPGYGQVQPAMAVAQPMQMQPMQPMQPMGGFGVAMLAQFGDLFIKQRVEMLEAITGFETANAYDIMSMAGGMPQQIFFAGEQSECCERQCCGSSRSFVMNIYSPANPQQPVFSIDRPLRCKPPACCCFLQELTVRDASGAEIGMLVQQYTCCASEFHVMVKGHLAYKVLGPICVCDGPFCGDQEFFVTAANDQRIQTPGGPARITKMGSRGFEGAMNEMFTDADNFGCTFPPDATPEAKAVLLAAVFMIDFLFFEDGGAAEGGHFGDD